MRLNVAYNHVEEADRPMSNGHASDPPHGIDSATDLPDPPDGVVAGEEDSLNTERVANGVAGPSHGRRADCRGIVDVHEGDAWYVSSFDTTVNVDSPSAR